MTSPRKPAFNMHNPSIKRILQEYREFKKDPNPSFVAEPLEDNLFEWHFTIRGAPDTDYQGGRYHGRILLPSEYPFKPPDVMMLTPSGRFETGRKICLSISGFHPQNWQPSWSIRTMLVALIAFFPTPPAGAIGSLDWTSPEKKKCAKDSADWKCEMCGKKNVELLPDLTEEQQSNLSKSQAKDQAALSTLTAQTAANNHTAGAAGGQAAGATASTATGSGASPPAVAPAGGGFSQLPAAAIAAGSASPAAKPAVATTAPGSPAAAAATATADPLGSPPRPKLSMAQAQAMVPFSPLSPPARVGAGGGSGQQSLHASTSSPQLRPLNLQDSSAGESKHPTVVAGSGESVASIHGSPVRATSIASSAIFNAAASSSASNSAGVAAPSTLSSPRASAPASVGSGGSSDSSAIGAAPAPVAAASPAPAPAPLTEAQLEEQRRQRQEQQRRADKDRLLSRLTVIVSLMILMLLLRKLVRNSGALLLEHADL